MTTHEHRALEHLEDAEAAQAELQATYAFKPVDHDRAGSLRARISFALKAALIYATLARADVGMEAIADHVTRHQAILNRQRGL